MKRRENTIFFYLLLSLILLLSACSSDVEDKSNNPTASFEVAAITSYDGRPEFRGIAESDWRGLPNQNLVQMKTCLSDTVLSVGIQNEPVRIETPLNTYEKETDTQGCITWNENIEFNYLAQETLFTYPVTITGLGAHKGHETIELVLNPWKRNQNILKDLRHDNITTTQGPLVTESKEWTDGVTQNPIQLKDIQFQKVKGASQFNGDTQVYTYNFQYKADFERLNIDGSQVSDQVSSGSFEVKAILVEKEDDQIWELSRTEKLISIKQSKGNALLEFAFTRGRRENPSNEIEVHFTIAPTIKSNLISPHHGILKMADIDKNSSSLLSPSNRDEKSLNIQLKPIKEQIRPLNIETEESSVELDTDKEVQAEEREENIEEEVPLDDDWGYSINTITSSYGALVQESFQSNKKTLRSRAVICLNNSNSQDGPLSRTKFRVNVIDKNGNKDQYPEERIHETGANGCFETYFYTHYEKYQCEQYINSTFILTALEGNVKDIKKSRSVAINPWNPQDFSYDLRPGQTAPDALNCVHPRVNLSQIGYRHEGVDKDSYKINQYLHLSLNKKYRFVLRPTLELFTSYQEERRPESINFGQFDMTISVHSPKTSSVNYQKPELEQFKLISSYKRTITVPSNGVINELVSLPFLAAELPFLSYKNIVIVTLAPKEQSSLLRKASFVVPFYGNATGADIEASLLSEDSLKNTQAEIEKLASSKSKWPGAREGEQFELSPLQLYRKEIERSGLLKSEEMQTISGTYLDFNELSSIEESEHMNAREMRALSKFAGKVPNKLARKFCALFEKRNSVSFKSCLETPLSFLKISPLSHIQRLVGAKEVDPQNFKGLMAISPKFHGEDQGKITRGNAFFAAHGDRSSLSQGQRKATSVNQNYSYGVEGPGPYFFGFSQGVSKSQEQYQVQNNAQMKAAFNRAYTAREAVNLTFNQLTLKFAASVRDCILIESKTKKPLQYHYCRDKDRLTRLKEDWFFIGNTDSQTPGIIADGNTPGETDKSQIIRGQDNFNRLWKNLERKDTLTIIEETGEVDLTDSFQNYVRGRTGRLPYDSYINNSFPGLFSPADYTPLTEK